MVILNVQFHNGDKEQAMKLARLIADLEPAKRNDAIMLFTARYDTRHDHATIRYCAEKFKTLEFTCQRVAHGWPNGPNQMMGESYSYCVEQSRRRLQAVRKVMFIESDCVPLARDWWSKISEEFDASGKMILGPWLTKGDCNTEHVNGNLMMSIDFWRRCKDVFNPPQKGGWDARLWPQIKPVAAPSKLIWSDYQLGMAHNPWRGCDYLWEPKRYRCPENPLYGQDLQPVWFHGIKVPDGIECSRKRLLG